MNPNILMLVPEKEYNFNIIYNILKGKKIGFMFNTFDIHKTMKNLIKNKK